MERLFIGAMSAFFMWRDGGLIGLQPGSWRYVEDGGSASDCCSMLRLNRLFETATCRLPMPAVVSVENGHALVVDGGLTTGGKFSESQARGEMMRQAMQSLVTEE